MAYKYGALREPLVQRIRIRVILAAICCGLGGRAVAATPQIDFNVQNQALGSALVEFAVQARISISTQNAKLCSGAATPLSGRFTVEAALTRLLAKSGCGFRRLDAGAFEIVRSPPPLRLAAQAPPAPPDSTGPELVVVATRRPAPVDRIGYSVSAVTSGALTDQGADDDASLATLTPSMTVTNLGMGRDKIMLRGLSDGPLTGRSQSMTGIYLDDVRLTFNAPDPDLRLVDIDQVEILRGPQGTLYGAGSMGGVVHMVTVRPDPTRFSGWMQASLGATAGGAGSNVEEGVLNLPFADQEGAARIVLYREIDGGYIRDPVLSAKNVNRSERDGARLAVRYDLDDQWQVVAGAIGQGIDNSDTQYTPEDGPAYSRNNRLREPHDNDFIADNVGLRGDLGWSELQTSLAYIQHRLFSRYDASSAPPVPVAATPVAFDEKTDIHSVVAEATLVSKGLQEPEWLMGAFYAHTSEKDEAAVSAPTASALRPMIADRGDGLDEGALYGEITFMLDRIVGVTSGGRLFTSEGQIEARVTSQTLQKTNTLDAAVHHMGFAPKLMIFARPSAETMVYALASEGYRAGGRNTPWVTSLSIASPSTALPAAYHGDELWNFEAGAKLDAYQDRLSLRLAAFEVDWKNLESDQLLASGLPVTANLGEAHNVGLEFEGRYRIGALVLGGNLLVDRPELVRAMPALPTLTNLTLAAVPDLSLGMSAHDAWRVTGRLMLEFDGRWAYVGGSRLALATAARPKMGDYSTGRLAAALASDPWRMTLAVDNPADIRGDTFAFGNPFTLRTTRQVTPLRPRTLTLALQVSF